MRIGDVLVHRFASEAHKLDAFGFVQRLLSDLFENFGMGNNG